MRLQATSRSKPWKTPVGQLGVSLVKGTFCACGVALVGGSPTDLADLEICFDWST